jgi:hypothetical protein
MSRPWQAIAAAITGALLSVASVPGVPLAAGAPGYQVAPASARGQVRFAVSYAGSGSYRTVYHGEPPNKGGPHDTNDATDSSSQRWALRFGGALTIPTCQPQSDQASDPCQQLQGLDGAGGTATLAARVKHVHRDGLFKADSVGINCRLVRRGRIPTAQGPTLRLSYASTSQTLAVTVTDPISAPFERFPGSCPKQGDSIDGLLDNYFTPGFSFAAGYGPDRWFGATSVPVPLALFHRAAQITIRLHASPAGTPPRDCAVAHPTYERCRTGGSWTGVLTLRAVA